MYGIQKKMFVFKLVNPSILMLKYPYFFFKITYYVKFNLIIEEYPSNRINECATISADKDKPKLDYT